jgi:hypothetical protein
VETAAAWLAKFRHAQGADFIVLGSKEGINDWDDAKARAGVKETSRRLSLTTHDWMMPYAMLAAQAALHILAGASPATMPIVPNRKWDIWANMGLLATTDIRLSKQLLQKAKKVY